MSYLTRTALNFYSAQDLFSLKLWHERKRAIVRNANPLISFATSTSKKNKPSSLQRAGGIASERSSVESDILKGLCELSVLKSSSSPPHKKENSLSVNVRACPASPSVLRKSDAVCSLSAGCHGDADDR